MDGSEPRDVGEARSMFPAAKRVTYFNTAGVGLASQSLIAAYREFVDGWAEGPLDFVRGEAAGESSRTAVAALLGVARSDVALIASVSAAAGLVAAQFGPARPGQNVVIGEREYSSNHYPWRLLADKGYDVRQVPFRNGGLEADDVARFVDRKTVLVAFSGVQTATGHRSDIRQISAIARDAGAIVFVDGSQLVGALPIAGDLDAVDVLAVPDHKFLLHAGRGLGYCYLSPEVQQRFVPVSAGWKAGRIPVASFFGPTMDLSATASRFDNSISWLAAIGNEAALATFDQFGAQSIYERNRQLEDTLRSSLIQIGWLPLDLPQANRSTIVAVPLGDMEPQEAIAELDRHGVICATRDGNLRFAVHLYNHPDDVDRLTEALSGLRRPTRS